MLQSNLKAVLDEKNISIRLLARDIDYRFETIRKFYNDELERYPRDMLDSICSYLGVTLNDLFIHSKTKK